VVEQLELEVLMFKPGVKPIFDYLNWRLDEKKSELGGNCNEDLTKPEK